MQPAAETVALGEATAGPAATAGREEIKTHHGDPAGVLPSTSKGARRFGRSQFSGRKMPVVVPRRRSAPPQVGRSVAAGGEAVADDRTQAGAHRLDARGLGQVAIRSLPEVRRQIVEFAGLVVGFVAAVP